MPTTVPEVRDSLTSVHPPESDYWASVLPPAGADDRTWEGAVVFRHSGWRRMRCKVLEAFKATEQAPSRVENFLDCGHHSYLLRNPDDHSQVKVAGSSCHDRFCLPCGRDRSRVIASNVLARLNGEPSRFVTLTLRSRNEPLRGLLPKLIRSFATLRKQAFWRTAVRGGVAFLEVKYNPAGLRWHAHLHILCHGLYIPKPLLRSAWLAITGDSFIVDLRFVKDQGTITSYVCKYASKPLDQSMIVDPERLPEAILAMKGTKLCYTFGDWRGLQLTESESDCDWENIGPLYEWLARFKQGDAEAARVLSGLDRRALDEAVRYTRDRAPPESAVQRPKQTPNIPDPQGRFCLGLQPLPDPFR